MQSAHPVTNVFQSWVHPFLFTLLLFPSRTQALCSVIWFSRTLSSWRLFPNFQSVMVVLSLLGRASDQAPGTALGVHFWAPLFPSGLLSGQHLFLSPSFPLESRRTVCSSSVLRWSLPLNCEGSDYIPQILFHRNLGTEMFPCKWPDPSFLKSTRREMHGATPIAPEREKVFSLTFNDCCFKWYDACFYQATFQIQLYVWYEWSY